jgi:hypothetical protein
MIERLQLDPDYLSSHWLPPLHGADGARIALRAITRRFP